MITIARSPRDISSTANLTYTDAVDRFSDALTRADISSVAKASPVSQTRTARNITCVAEACFNPDAGFLGDASCVLETGVMSNAGFFGDITCVSEAGSDFSDAGFFSHLAYSAWRREAWPVAWPRQR